MAQGNNTEVKRIPAIEVEANAYGLTLKFSHGKRLALEASQLSDEIRAQALIHGLKQKLVDAAAISRNPTTGLSATVEDKYQAVREVYARLLEGEWNAVREGGAGSMSLLLAALIRQTGKTAEQLKPWLEKKTDAEKKALSLNPKIAELINTIRAERAKIENIDTDEILSELDNME